MTDIWSLERFIIGLRHKRTFSASDKFGEFLDKVIPLQGTYPFPEKCFTKLGKPDNLSVEIRDAEGTLSAIYGTDGLTLNCDMAAEPPIDVSTVEEMFIALVNIAVPLTEGKNNIDRMGAVFQYAITPFENSAKEIFSKSLKVNMQGTPDNIMLRFALKNPTSDAIFCPDKKADYRNVFVEMTSERAERIEGEEKEAEKGDGLSFPTVIKLAVDYQYYYIPVRSFKAINIKSHISEAQKYINETVKTTFDFRLSQNAL